VGAAAAAAAGATGVDFLARLAVGRAFTDPSTGSDRGARGRRTVLGDAAAVAAAAAVGGAAAENSVKVMESDAVGDTDGEEEIEEEDNC